MYGKNIILDTDSKYSRIIVAQMQEPVSGRSLLALFTGRFFYPAGGYQSAVYLENEDLATKYLKFFRLGEYFKHGICKALLIGGDLLHLPEIFWKEIRMQALMLSNWIRS